jgi:ferric-dicitrate binding protein FerR (iron transport regulator)
MTTEQRSLLNKYLSSDCTPEELEQVKLLLDQPGTEAMLHELMEERAAGYDAAIPDEALTAKVKEWEERVMNSITASQPSAKVRNLQPRHWMRYAAVMAGLLLSVILLWWLIRASKDTATENTAFVEQLNEEAFPVRYFLPDSSIVFLGAGSRLRYPAHFNSNSRELHLNGEAFFDAKPDKDRPFTVHTRTMQTLVLGTSFKIEAHDHHPITVAVASGKVSVAASQKGQPQTLGILIPGHKIIFDEAKGNYRQGTTDVQGLIQWTAGDLVFDEQPLDLVMKQLEKRYHISVSFSKPSTARYKVSGSFAKDQDIHSVMTMLGTIGKFKHIFLDKQTVIIQP